MHIIFVFFFSFFFFHFKTSKNKKKIVTTSPESHSKIMRNEWINGEGWFSGDEMKRQRLQFDFFFLLNKKSVKMNIIWIASVPQFCLSENFHRSVLLLSVLLAFFYLCPLFFSVSISFFSIRRRRSICTAQIGRVN